MVNWQDVMALRDNKLHLASICTFLRSLILQVQKQYLHISKLLMCP